MNLLEKQQYFLENVSKVPAEALEDYQTNFAEVLAKNSSTIEGESVTFAQVIQIIKGINVANDSVLNRKIYNNYLAFKLVAEKASKKEPLTEDFFKDVHEALMKDIAIGGIYRNVNIKINGSSHTPCDYLKVYDRMAKFFYDIENFEGTPIELAAYTHLQIAKVHPFLDGNGRMARLMMNYELISHGFLPVSVPVKHRNEYFETLEEFKVNKNPVPFTQMLETLLNKEYDRAIEMINQYVK